MDVDREQGPGEGEVQVRFRPQHHPRMIWFGMVVAVTVAFALGAFTR